MLCHINVIGHWFIFWKQSGIRPCKMAIMGSNQLRVMSRICEHANPNCLYKLQIPMIKKRFSTSPIFVPLPLPMNVQRLGLCGALGHSRDSLRNVDEFNQRLIFGSAGSIPCVHKADCLRQQADKAAVSVSLGELIESVYRVPQSL